MLNRRSLLAGSLTLVPSASFSQPTGRFAGPLDARFNDDGRTLTLLRPYTYIATSGVKWTTPAGALVDGASIPRFLWTLVGGPLEGKYRNASVIHDYYCDVRSRPHKEVHHVFLEAMLANGVPVRQAMKMFAGVWVFGPTWSSTVVHNNRLSFQDIQPLLDNDTPDAHLVTLRAAQQAISTTLYSLEQQTGESVDFARVVASLPNADRTMSRLQIAEFESRATSERFQAVANILGRADDGVKIEVMRARTPVVEDFIEIEQWIDENDPSPERLEQYLDERYRNK